MLLSNSGPFACMNSVPYSAILSSQSGFVRRFLVPRIPDFLRLLLFVPFPLGMGSPLTPIYDSDAPEWLRVSKDVVWLAVLLVGLVFSNAESRTFARLNRRLHTAFFRTLLALVCLFVLMGEIHLFYHQSTPGHVLVLDSLPPGVHPGGILHADICCPLNKRSW